MEDCPYHKKPASTISPLGLLLTVLNVTLNPANALDLNFTAPPFDPHAHHRQAALVPDPAAVDHSQHFGSAKAANPAAVAAPFGEDEHAHHAQGFEMDPNRNSTMPPGPRYRMLMFMHTEFTDYVLLKEWLILDGNYGGMIGACIGVFLLAIFTEFVKALRQAMQLTNCRVFCRSVRLGLGQRARGPAARAGGSSSTTIDCCAAPTGENARLKRGTPAGAGASAGASGPVVVVESPDPQGGGGGPAAGPGQAGDAYLRPPDNGPASTAHSNLIAVPVPPVCRCPFASSRFGKPLRNAALTALYGCHVSLSYILMLVVMTYSVWLCIAVVAGAVLGFFLFNCWPLGWIGQPPPAACHLSDDEETTSAASCSSGHMRQLVSGQTEAGDCCH